MKFTNIKKKIDTPGWQNYGESIPLVYHWWHVNEYNLHREQTDNIYQN